MSGSSEFERVMTVLLMMRASLDPRQACDGTFDPTDVDQEGPLPGDREGLAAVGPDWHPDNAQFYAAAAEARYRGLLDGTEAGATEAELRVAVERLREALYLMTSLATQFLSTYSAATSRSPLEVLDQLADRLRTTMVNPH